MRPSAAAKAPLTHSWPYTGDQSFPFEGRKEIGPGRGSRTWPRTICSELPSGQGHKDETACAFTGCLFPRKLGEVGRKCLVYGEAAGRSPTL